MANVLDTQAPVNPSPATMAAMLKILTTRKGVPPITNVNIVAAANPTEA